MSVSSKIDWHFKLHHADYLDEKKTYQFYHIETGLVYIYVPPKITNSSIGIIYGDFSYHIVGGTYQYIKMYQFKRRIDPSQWIIYEFGSSGGPFTNPVKPPV